MNIRNNKNPVIAPPIIAYNIEAITQLKKIDKHPTTSGGNFSI